MKEFLIHLVVMASVFFPVFFLVWAVLWKLKSRGAWTVALGFVFEPVLLLAGFAVSPAAMRYGGAGYSPVEQGIVMGCCMPIVFMFLYHMAQKRERAKESGSEC